MPDVKRGTQLTRLIGLHLSVGSLIFPVVLARIGWRAMHSVLQEPSSDPPPMRLVARATHWALYTLLTSFPLMGWATALSKGWQVSLFGIIPFPLLSPAGAPLGHEMGDIHQVLSWVLIAVVAIHVLAALFHRFIVKDDTLRRMLPARR